MSESIATDQTGYMAKPWASPGFVGNKHLHSRPRTYLFRSPQLICKYLDFVALWCYKEARERLNMHCMADSVIDQWGRQENRSGGRTGSFRKPGRHRPPAASVGDVVRLGACRRTGVSEAVGKCSAARHPIFFGMRRTYRYAAVTKGEDNAAGGGFPAAS